MENENQKLVVPKYIGWRWATEADADKEKDFTGGIIKLFNLQFPENWFDYVKLNFTENFFTISSRDYPSETFGRFKREKEFKLKPEQAQNIDAHVKRKIKAQIEREAHRTESERLQKLAVPVIERYKGGDFNLKFRENPFHIEIEKDWKDYKKIDGKILLFQNGKISAPMSIYKQSVQTVAQAEKFISELKAMSPDLIEFAKKLKSELPKEFFTDEKTKD